MTKLMKSILLGVACTLGALPAFSQANYWTFGSNYLNFTTPTATVTTTAPTNPVDLDPSLFAVPGLCSTYYSLSWDDHITPIHFNSLTLHNNGTGTPFTFLNLVSDGYSHFGASAAVAPLAADGTRKLYAAYDNVINSWTLNADGTLAPTPPVTIYTGTAPTGTYSAFDSRVNMEVSSDGKYLLVLSNPASKVLLVDINAHTATTLTSPSNYITGFEYVAGWGTAGRVYISYHSFNAVGAGIGYFDLGNNNIYTGITTAPAGKSINGFGYSEIEKGKNGLLYVGYNTNWNIPINGNYYPNGTAAVYSLSSANVFTATTLVASTPSGFSNNYNTPIATQIDGENYTAATYPTPTVSSLKLNGLSGFATPSYTSTPTIYRCNGGDVLLSSVISGLASNYVITVTTGIIMSNNTWLLQSSSTFPTTNNPVSLSSVLPTYTGDVKISVQPVSACSTSVAAVSYYFRIANASALANYTTIACNGNCGKPNQTTLPITATAPTPNINNNIFRNNIDAKQGWVAPASGGLYNVNISPNAHYTYNVYEVDGNTGARKVRNNIIAPNIVQNSDINYPYVTGVVGPIITNSYSIGFDPTNPPFYNDLGSYYGAGGYMYDFYVWSYSAGSLNTDYSTRVYCADLTVTEPTSGCVTNNKSYFRVANNGVLGGKTARLAESSTENLIEPYPNPANSTITIKIPYTASKATLILIDNMGRKVQEFTALQTGKNELNIQQLPTGIYLYEINVDGELQHGKLIKQ